MCLAGRLLGQVVYKNNKAPPTEAQIQDLISEFRATQVPELVAASPDDTNLRCVCGLVQLMLRRIETACGTD